MRAIALSACLGATLWLLGCGEAASGRVLRLAHGLDTSHPVHRAMLAMAEDLERSSGGALKIRIYPSEQLGSERECLELLQIGSLAMTKVSASVLESFAPEFEVFGVPYLFESREHQFRVVDGEIGRDLLEATLGARLRGLAFLDAGSRSFYTRRAPVRSPQDLAGLKIRTQESATAMGMVRALGGSPTPISWGELYSALQQGVVDGAENNPPSFHLSRHYEVSRFYSLDEHTMVPDVLLVASSVWDSLSPGDRARLSAAARVGASRQRELWQVATESALAAVEAAGVEITRPEKRPFRDRVADLQAELASRPHLVSWVRRIEAAREGTVP